MITDGYPTDYSGNKAMMAINDVNALRAAAATQITLSTVYYGKSNDPSAINLLNTMAQAGAGQFANVNLWAGAFKIDDVIPGAMKDCPVK